MTGLLESSHVLAQMPAGNRAGRRIAGAEQAATPAGNIESCGGLLIAFGRRGLLSRVVRVDSKSFLHAAGVRPGWRFLGKRGSEPAANESLTLAFTSTAGERVDITVPSSNRDEPVDVDRARQELESWSRMLVGGADPDTELTMASLGIIIRVGRNGELPVVVDVENRSEAERASIEPGSLLSSWRTGPADDGALRFEGKLISPAGAEYSAAFDFRRCEVADRASSALPGDVLLLRFNSFQPDIVAWLDEQLHSQPRAVILDLRRNGGGDAAVMQQVLGRFLEDGAKVAEIIYVDRSETWVAKAATGVYKGPLAILVGPQSASAAELSASALAFHARAKIFGQATRGNVLLSSSYPLADGGRVQVAIADIRSAGGKRLEDVGVQVDEVVTPTLATVRAGKDVVLEAALASFALSSH
jgi:carboxyl-terminal processing protease